MRDIYFVVSKICKFIPDSETQFKERFDWFLIDVAHKPPEQRNQTFYWERISDYLNSFFDNPLTKDWQIKIIKIWMNEESEEK